MENTNTKEHPFEEGNIEKKESDASQSQASSIFRLCALSRAAGKRGHLPSLRLAKAPGI